MLKIEEELLKKFLEDEIEFLIKQRNKLPKYKYEGIMYYQGKIDECEDIKRKLKL